MFKYVVALLLSLAVLPACGSIMIQHEAQVPPKPAADTATLVVFRNSNFNSAVPVDLYLDKEFIGRTDEDSYFVTQVPAGSHFIVALSNGNTAAKINLEAGKVYYLFLSAFARPFGISLALSGSTPKDFKEDLDDRTYLECCTPGESKPTIDSDEWQDAVSDYAEEVKEDPKRHKDTEEMKGY